ncbi:MAG TPA: ribokinase [Pseudolysinimonas sp.]|jgi:ribokinase|nr:ribokinase [Pseudolysinimonas sp.]
MSAIVVLGSANMDLVVRQPRLPHPGETMFGSSFDQVPGGKGLNQAVAAARAGGDVGFLGAVGRDAFGEALRRCLEQDGVDTHGVVEVDEPTGTAHISVLDGGENAIVVVSGANAAITELDDASKRRIEDARYLVAQFERPLELIGEAFVLARGLGIQNVLTPAPVQPVDHALLQLVDILIPNAQEACELAGVDDETEAAVALSRTVGMVVMTRGSRGALVARDGAVLTEVAPRKVEAVDTTAAGDTFAGVLIAFLAEGAALDDALDAATVAASISVTRPGASTSMPTRAEIDREL